MITTINNLLTSTFDALLVPFAKLSPEWGLVFISLLSGVLFLLLYGKFSNQAKIKQVKRGISANMLEAVLFRHDLRLSLAAQGRMFASGFLYLSYAIKPLLVLLIPCLLVLAQLNLRYNYRPLKVGEQALVQLELENDKDLAATTLQVGSGISMTAPLKIPSEKTVLVRVQSTEASAQDLVVTINGQTAATSKLIVGPPAKRISSEASKSWWQELLYPSDIEIAPPLKKMSISYPEASCSILGIQLHWLIWFFVLSLISGLVAAKVVGIEI